MAVRVGIVGTGWGVKTQVPAFRRAGLNVVALCGRDLAKVLAEQLPLLLLNRPRHRRPPKSCIFLTHSMTGAS